MLRWSELELPEKVVGAGGVEILFTDYLPFM